MTDRHTSIPHLPGAEVAHRAAARLMEGVRYRRALRALRRLDDRDLDDLDLGRGDLPGLARRHARGEPAFTRQG
jgi:uncharacterized protein YjiS (DUF1127 family)